MNLTYEELKNLFKDKLLANGFSNTDAALISQIFADNSSYGVLSHGANRFPSFMHLVKEGIVDVNAKPSLVNSNNAFQQWDGNYGPGTSNAWFITDKVIELAEQYGIGCIGLRNTNHWMRAGTYGWKAAEKGYILICWTNTLPNMPPYGGKDPVIGNNPIVLAVPHKDKPVVLDIAMSQFSYGKINNYRLAGKKLPFPGGYDKDGNLTDDPQAIYDSFLASPIGYWKGAGLSLLLDLITTILSGGRATKDMVESKHDFGMSQTFIAIDPSKSASADQINSIVDGILDFYKSADTFEGQEIFYPGERALASRKRSMKEGITLDDTIYNKIMKL